MLLQTYLEMARKSNFLHRPDKPLGRIILIPLDGISVVHGELMMEIVVSFTNRHQSSGKVVAGRVLVIKGRLAEPVSEGIDTERGLRIN